MWSSSHIHGPRRSHDQSRNDLKASRASSPDDSGTEGNQRRTSSDATPRQAPATTRFLDSVNDQHANWSVLSPASALPSERPEGYSSSKRLGYFADKLTSSLSGTGKDTSTNLKNSLHPSQLLHPHSHSRVESSSTTAPSLSSTMASSSALTSANKAHASPSKVPFGRTYDPKVVSREMQRLGNLVVPSSLAPQLSQAPSVTSLALPPPGNTVQANVSSSSSNDPWGALHVHVLPLFNGEPLRIPIEDLNILVKRHIQSVVSSYPSKALATLENDASELIASGMVTLNAKLTGIDDEKLVARVVEIWGFFWDQVLTYLEGVLLPLQTDPLLSSLYRTPKSHRASSPTRQTGAKASISSLSSTSAYHIDVRSVALKSFRDRVILPPFQRLYARLSIASRQDGLQEANSYQQPRLQQMLLVLASQSTQLPVTFSLNTRIPQPTAGESAVKDLLRLVRNPRPESDPRNPRFKGSPGFQTRTPSFLSGGLPRDRRGRVALKGKIPPDLTSLRGLGFGSIEDPYGDDTPRMGGIPASYAVDMDRERDREFLEGLRSPDVEPGGRVTSGGWGLGAGNVENSKEEDEDEMDWDQAQVPFSSILLRRDK
ncbi:hypothetical protein HYPSUDRAFT_34894 [Hypholoma sublateritium FD-334 SS-4]|uniref:HbrB-like protein n=1 Tax=Hypholoma sublateritium (strain FD-334 SS-4) TaxID=945553 RepID=A0A0D2Q7S3_HYPSF|nr:hypothetical protein HYPSUDRAFT_34894 [Hypholoma sublateritium FD-334 SS-4]